MTADLFYDPEFNPQQPILEGPEWKHCNRVLRHGPGDLILVTDGLGQGFQCRIGRVQPDHGILEILGEKMQPPPLRFRIALAPARQAERFEWFLEKSAEIGILEVIPVITERSLKRKWKPDRLKKVLVAAMKQSGSFWLANLCEFTRFDDLLRMEGLAGEERFIATMDGLPHLKSAYQAGGKALVLVGPEGDFSSAEAAGAANAGFLPVNLGRSRLRSETAALYALQTLALAHVS